MTFKYANKFQTDSGTIPTPIVDTFNGATEVTPATDVITLTGHTFTTNMAVRLTGTTPPAPLVSGNVYFVIVVDANNIKLASSPGGLGNPNAGMAINQLPGPVVNISATAAGVFTLTSVLVIQYPQRTERILAMTSGSTMLVQCSPDINAPIQLWKNWAPGTVAGPAVTDAELLGYQALMFTGTGQYSTKHTV